MARNNALTRQILESEPNEVQQILNAGSQPSHENIKQLTKTETKNMIEYLMNQQIETAKKLAVFGVDTYGGMYRSCDGTFHQIIEGKGKKILNFLICSY